MVIKMNKKRILLFCAHPDDAELCAGGTIIKFVKKGYDVRIIVMTNGNAGNNDIDKKTTSMIRKQELKEAASFLKCDIKCLNINDGEVVSSLKYRNLVIGEIRKYKPDIIMTHRANDYHPDHRYTSILVQDSLVLICSGNYCPEFRPLDYTPITLFFWDRFTKPNAFTPDIVLDITKEFDEKIQSLSIHKSQFSNYDECKKVLNAINNQMKSIVKSNYDFIELFEICEYAKLEELEAFNKLKKEVFN